MKKLFLLSALAVIFFLTGCQQESNFLSPADNQQVAGKTWVELDYQTQTSLLKAIVVQQDINGATGGEIVISDSKVQASLIVPEGSFSGTVNFKVKINDKHAYIDFDPSIAFAVPLIFNCTIIGLNLSDDQVTFGYLNDGSIEEAEYASVDSDISTGTLSVTGAKINHFSRYGWAK